MAFPPYVVRSWAAFRISIYFAKVIQYQSMISSPVELEYTLYPEKNMHRHNNITYAKNSRKINDVKTNMDYNRSISIIMNYWSASVA